MFIKDCRKGELESVTGVSNLKDVTTRTNQNGVLKTAEDEATGSITGDKIKRSRKLTEKELQYRLEQLKKK